MLLKEIANRVTEGEVVQGNFPKKGKVLLSFRRDVGDEWKYWNGVNWFATKARALPVTQDEVEKLESTWGLKARQERVAMNEEALETRPAEDVWGENKDSSAEYTSSTTYQVRPIKDSKPTMFEVFSVVGTNRKPFGKFTAAQLSDTLKPIRPNQTPDAEGFTIYTDPAKIEAFKYTSDPIRVQISNEEKVTLNKGDYLVRTVKGSSFEYSVETAGDFEATLKKA